MTIKKCPVCNGDGNPIIEGRRASEGCVQGEVYLVANAEESVNIPDGAILVTSMTDPDCVIAMGSSAAIVTDRGGILCHAAIVSRELGKPCIVGTGKATSVLNNGKTIRVCANKGIIFTS